MEKPRIGIIISTIRKARFGDKPARWVFDISSKRTDLDVEIVDLRDYPLPNLGETATPGYDDSSSSEVASRWSQKIAELPDAEGP